MAESPRKEFLRAELAAARDRLGGHTLGLRRKLSPAEAVKRGVHHYPAAWFGGAVLLGLLLSRIPARRKKVKVEVPSRRGDIQASGAGKAVLVATVLKFGLELAKPSLLRWLRGRVTDYVSARSAPRAPAVPPATTVPVRPRQVDLMSAG